MRRDCRAAAVLLGVVLVSYLIGAVQRVDAAPEAGCPIAPHLAESSVPPIDPGQTNAKI
jgi:hypothetical protein